MKQLPRPHRGINWRGRPSLIPIIFESCDMESFPSTTLQLVRASITWTDAMDYELGFQVYEQKHISGGALGSWANISSGAEVHRVHHEDNRTRRDDMLVQNTADPSVTGHVHHLDRFLQNANTLCIGETRYTDVAPKRVNRKRNKQ